MAPIIGEPLRFHWFPVADDDVRTTLPPRQKATGPPALIVGLTGRGFIVIFTVLREFAHVPEFAVIVY